MMRRGIWSSLMLCIIPIIVVSPGFATAEGPGIDHGTIPDPNNPVDIYFKANYSYVYTNNDQSGEWVSGATVTDVEYRDQSTNPPDQIYDYFFKKATTLWIRITWQDQNQNQFSEIYPFADVSDNDNGKFKFANSTAEYIEGNSGPGARTTDFSGEYVIDVNNDDIVDFKINETVTLNRFANPGNVPGGELEMMYYVADHPTNWSVGGNTAISMEFAFYIDIDINNTDNDVLFWNPLSTTWENQDIEIGPVAVPYSNGIPVACVNITDGNRKAVLVPGNNFESWADYYILNNHYNEYSQYPSNYVNDEQLDSFGANPVLWYVVGYNIALNNFPPGVNNIGTIFVGGLTA